MIIYWIWLSHLKYVCPVLQKKLLDHFRTSKAVYDATEEELLIIPRISKKAIQSIQSSRSLKEAEALLKSTRKAGVDMLTFEDKLYPHFASKCKESPILLFYKETSSHWKPPSESSVREDVLPMEKEQQKK